MKFSAMAHKLDDADGSHGAPSGSQHSAGRYFARWDTDAPTPAETRNRVAPPSLRERLLAKPWKTMVEENHILRNWNRDQNGSEKREPPHKRPGRGWNLTREYRQQRAARTLGVSQRESSESRGLLTGGAGNREEKHGQSAPSGSEHSAGRSINSQHSGRAWNWRQQSRQHEALAPAATREKDSAVRSESICDGGGSREGCRGHGTLRDNEHAAGRTVVGGTKRLAETAQSPTPTHKLTIIFADGGQIGESLLHDIVPDPRPPLDIFDVPEINDELGANCVLQVDWLGKKPFISVITAEVDLCSLDEVLLSSQAFSFPASLATIRHPGLFSGELRVLGIRILKGKTDSDLFSQLKNARR